MPNWKQTIDLSDIWDEVTEDETRVGEICTVIADRLEALIPGAADEKDANVMRSFIQAFRDLVDDEPDFAKFNYYWADFYDWADSGYKMWIEL